MLKFLKKYWKNIFYILWWIFYLNIGRVLLEGKGWGPNGGDNALRGALLIIYPLTLCHLYSFTKTGRILEFRKEQADQFTPTQNLFALLTIYGSSLTFVFLNIIHLIVYSIDIVRFLSR